jgi:hypothetical protein
VKRWVVVLAVGCGGKPEPCAAVAEHAVSLVHLLGSAADYPDDPRAPLRSMIIRRCEQDDWSNDARACMVEAKQLDDFHACDVKLTPEQQGALAGEMLRLMDEVTVVKRKPSAPVVDSAQTLSFVIHVRGEHQLEVAGHAIDDAELDRALHALDPATQVVIRAAPGVPHGVVVHVLEQAKAAGLTKLAIATDAVQ